MIKDKPDLYCHGNFILDLEWGQIRTGKINKFLKNSDNYDPPKCYWDREWLGGYNVWCTLFDKRQDLSWKLLYEKDETMPVNIWRKTQLQVIFKDKSPKKWPVWCASGLGKKSHCTGRLMNKEKSNRKEEGSIPRSQINYSILEHCNGEGNGNPLQCACLENPRDG